MQPARIFLRHARKDTLAAGSLDTNTNARKRLFEASTFSANWRSAEVYQVSWPSFRRSDQCRCDGFSWWRCRTLRRGIDKRQCGCGLENPAA
jgi:hypothetical protein